MRASYQLEDNLQLHIARRQNIDLHLLVSKSYIECEAEEAILSDSNFLVLIDQEASLRYSTTALTVRQAE